MNFEYYDDKSKINKAKHGIDFQEVQKLWKDERMLQVSSLFEYEERYLNIGKIYEVFYTVITTYRGNSIRIISARRSRKKEIEVYESRRI
jgi:uncharacterized DUF497 family protein